MGLAAYADPYPGSILHVKQAIELFGGVYIGLQLPDGFQNMTVWDISGPPDPNQGHCVWVPKYDDPTKQFTCVTWGSLQPMTYGFFETYVDEAHALLTQVWLQKAPPKFKLGDLLTDLGQISGTGPYHFSAGPSVLRS